MLRGQYVMAVHVAHCSCGWEVRRNSHQEAMSELVAHNRQEHRSDSEPTANR